MKRREFIKNISFAAGAGIASFSLSGIPVKAFAKSFLNINSFNGRILVIIQLKGGNDGLNTVIPLDQYSLYQSNRPNIGIARSNVLTLNSNTGLHPSMQPLKNLYDNGKVVLVQNVGYQNQNRSHFRSTDIWLSGSDANQFLYDGWIGRYLPQVYPDYPNNVPQHPMAVQIGSVGSMLFQNVQYGPMGISFQTPNSFYQLTQGIQVDNDPSPNTLAGDELKFLKEIAAQSVQYASAIRDKANLGNPTADYTAGETFGSQLKIVASLILGGLQTPVYLVTLDGFDNHSNEETTNNHPKLLSDLSNGINAFQTDMKNNDLDDKVVMMTFSEFGRRVKENASLGTDHGAAMPIFIVGANINAGIIGQNANLSSLDSNGDIKYFYDFRQIYASMLKDQFGLTTAQVKNVLLQDFQTLPIIKQAATEVLYNSSIPSNYTLKQNYPNPFNPNTKIEYALPEPGNVKLKVYDMLGRNVKVLVDCFQGAGTYTVDFYGSTLSSGTYIYSLETEKQRFTKKMVLVK